MADKMQAVVVHAYGDFRLEEVPRPQVGPNEVAIRVGGAGICAADRKFYTHGPWKLPFPFITGHEFAGVVVELGEGAAQKHGLRVEAQLVEAGGVGNRLDADDDVHIS